MEYMFKRPNVLLKFEVQVVEHCNQNCKNCTHYAPLAPKEFLDIEEYTRDCKRLSELFQSEVEWVRLMGGEALLHPKINDIMRITRESFHFGHIMLVTNGLLLPKMGQKFWNTCQKYKIEIGITKYPTSLDYKEVENKMSEYGVQYQYYGGEDKNRMQRFLIDLKGDFDPVQNYYSCCLANVSNTLRAGKMYTCFTSAHVHHLKEYFDLDMALSERNGVDIYKVKSADELMKKLAEPIPFCRYCDYANRDDYGDNWQVSIKDKYEWISFTYSDDDIRYLQNAHKVYIYGAGNWGRKVLHKLIKRGVDIESIIVSSQEHNADSICHIPIVALSQIETPNQNDICILAVNGNAKIEIQDMLYRKGFKRLIPLLHE